MKTIKIREGVADDIAALSHIFMDIRLNQSPWLDPDKVRNEKFSELCEGEDIYLAQLSGDIVGFISMWAPDSFVHHLYVAGDWRGKGIGKMLLAYVRDRYPGPFRLKCDSKNVEALKFYDHLGWEKKEERAGDFGKYWLLETP